MYTIIYPINISCLCIKDDYKNVFNFITGLLCIYIHELHSLNQIFH